MSTAGFLDTGVFVGYCLTVDKHHKPCNTYITEEADLLFTSETVLNEYPGTKRNASSRYSDAVRKHLSDVKKSDLKGELGPMEINRLQTQILDRRNELHSVLYELYEDLPPFIQYSDLIERLVALGRDIDTLALQRKGELDSIVDVWEQKEEHPDLRHELSIHEPDLSICIEGHDLALHLADETELATANPTDFVYEGQREHILSVTAYTDVVDLSG